MMDTFYHPTWESSVKVTDGTKWCSNYLVSLPNDKTLKTATATQGLNAKSKCSWQFKTEDGDTGPTIKLKSASFVDFLFHWTEWLNVSGLGTNAVLNGDIVANFQLG